jgi:hypothetical protein
VFLQKTYFYLFFIDLANNQSTRATFNPMVFNITVNRKTMENRVLKLLNTKKIGGLVMVDLFKC